MFEVEKIRYIIPKEQLGLYDSYARGHGLAKGVQAFTYPGADLPGGIIAVDWSVVNKDTYELTGGGHGFITHEAHRKAAAAIDRARSTKEGDPHLLGYAAMLLASLAIAQKEGNTNVTGNPWPHRLRKSVRRAFGNKRIPAEAKEMILAYYRVAQDIHKGKVPV